MYILRTISVTLTVCVATLLLVTGGATLFAQEEAINPGGTPEQKTTTCRITKKQPEAIVYKGGSAVTISLADYFAVTGDCNDLTYTTSEVDHLYKGHSNNGNDDIENLRRGGYKVVSGATTITIEASEQPFVNSTPPYYHPVTLSFSYEYQGRDAQNQPITKTAQGSVSHEIPIVPVSVFRTLPNAGIDGGNSNFVGEIVGDPPQDDSSFCYVTVRSAEIEVERGATEYFDLTTYLSPSSECENLAYSYSYAGKSVGVEIEGETLSVQGITITPDRFGPEVGGDSPLPERPRSPWGHYTHGYTNTSPNNAERRRETEIVLLLDYTWDSRGFVEILRTNADTSALLSGIENDFGFQFVTLLVKVVPPKAETLKRQQAEKCSISAVQIAPGAEITPEQEGGEEGNGIYDHLTVGGDTRLSLDEYFSFSDSCVRTSYSTETEEVSEETEKTTGGVVITTSEGTGEYYLKDTLTGSLLTLTGKKAGRAWVEVTAEAVGSDGTTTTKKQRFSLVVADTPEVCTLSLITPTPTVEVFHYGTTTIDLLSLYRATDSCQFPAETEDRYTTNSHEVEHVSAGHTEAVDTDNDGTPDGHKVVLVTERDYNSDGITDAHEMTIEGEKVATAPLTVTVRDTSGISLSIPLEITVTDPPACSIQKRIISTQEIVPGETLTIDIDDYLPTGEGCVEGEYSTEEVTETTVTDRFGDPLVVVDNGDYHISVGTPSDKDFIYTLTGSVLLIEVPAGKTGEESDTVQVTRKTRGHAPYTDTDTTLTFTVQATATAPTCTLTTATPTISDRQMLVGTKETIKTADFFVAEHCGTVTYTSSVTDETKVTAAGTDPLTLSALAEGTATVTVTATAGQTQAQDTFTITVVPLTCTITTTPIPTQTIDEGATLSLDISPYFSAVNCNPLTYEGDITNTFFTLKGLGKGDATLTLEGKKRGTATVTLTAGDGVVTTTAPMTVTVERPVVCTVSKRSIPDQLLIEGETRTLDISSYFTTNNCNGTPTYAGNISSKTATVTGLGVDDGSMTIEGKTEGHLDVTVTMATDGKTVTDTFRVTVQLPAQEKEECAVSSETTTLPEQRISVGELSFLSLSDYYTLTGDCNSDSVRFDPAGDTQPIDTSQFHVFSSYEGEFFEVFAIGSPTNLGETRISIRGVKERRGVAYVHIHALTTTVVLTIPIVVVTQSDDLPSCTITAKGSIPDREVRIGTAATLDVSNYFTFTDCSGSVVTYSYTASDEEEVLLTGLGKGNAFLTMNPQAEGRETVTVTAQRGEVSHRQTFDVVVKPPFTETESLQQQLAALQAQILQLMAQIEAIGGN